MDQHMKKIDLNADTTTTVDSNGMDQHMKKIDLNADTTEEE
jgi:hypothetical protein